MPSPWLRSERARLSLRWAAIALNGVLFLVGVYFEFRPRYRTDVWSAGALCAIALINSAALTTGTDGSGARHLRRRLRRIALLASLLLVGAGVLLAVLEASRGGSSTALSSLLLLLPPALSAAAILDDRGSA
jgi:hypothetical protein